MKTELIGWRRASKICDEWAEDFKHAPTPDSEMNAGRLELEDFWRTMSRIIARRKWTGVEHAYAIRAVMMIELLQKAPVMLVDIIEESDELVPFLKSKINYELGKTFEDGSAVYFRKRDKQDAPDTPEP